MMSTFLQNRKNKHDIVAAYFQNPIRLCLEGELSAPRGQLPIGKTV